MIAPHVKVPTLQVLLLEQCPIYEQLLLEEALLRADTRNWCLINQGSSPACVMGISGNPDQLLYRELYLNNPLPLIRRYSGGGTVIVEENSLFITWIFNHASIPIHPFPQEVMRWSESLIAALFSPLPIQLREHDYVLDQKKCGGNAQYFIKNRLVHHTSFLWDYSHHLMEYLKVPTKQPSYRQNRSHTEFLCTLKPYFETREILTTQLQRRLAKLFDCQIVSLDEAQKVQKRPHRIATQYVTW